MFQPWCYSTRYIFLSSVIGGRAYLLSKQASTSLMPNRWKPIGLGHVLFLQTAFNLSAQSITYSSCKRRLSNKEVSGWANKCLLCLIIIHGFWFWGQINLRAHLYSCQNLRTDFVCLGALVCFPKDRAQTNHNFDPNPALTWIKKTKWMEPGTDWRNTAEHSGSAIKG